MAAATMAVHLPKHSSFLPKSRFPSEKNTNFLCGSLNLRRPKSLNRESNGPVMVSASSTSKTVVTDDVDGDKSKRFYINFTGFPFLMALSSTGVPSEPRFSFSPSLNLHRDRLISLLQFQNHQSIMPESLTKIYSILNLICLQAIKGCIWMFEQEQALVFSSVSTNIRMTVIKLKFGGLWVHPPIAPTKECIQLIKELGPPVEYIILPTFAYEHKTFVGPFSRKFPKAQVWVM